MDNFPVWMIEIFRKKERTWEDFGKLWEAGEHPDKVYLCHRLLQRWNVDHAITDYAKFKGWKESTDAT
jgi:hypothetical protein